MDLRKVKPGDEVRNDAGTYNAFVDAANYVRATGRVTSDDKNGRPANASVIMVQNVSGARQDRYTAMAFRAPVILPSANQEEFDKRVAMTVDVPVTGDEGRWCVLLRNVDDGEFGLAVVTGVVQCRINLLGLGDQFCEIADGKVHPSSGSSGLGAILWTAGGGTGIRDAVIRVGGAGGSLPIGQYAGMFWGMVTNNQAAYTYPFAVQTVI